MAKKDEPAAPPMKTDSITFRVDPDLKAKATRAAYADNRSLGSWIEILLRNTLMQQQAAGRASRKQGHG